VGWQTDEIPDRFKVYRRTFYDIEGDDENDDLDDDWRLIAEGTPEDFAHDYDTGHYYYKDIAPGGRRLYYTVHSIVGKKVSKATNDNIDMIESPLTNAWELATENGAYATMSRIYESGTHGGYFARINITDAGTLVSDIAFKQELPTASAGSQYYIKLRARSMEDNRSITVKLRKKLTPSTIFGEETFALTQEWTWHQFTCTVTEATNLIMVMYCGTDTADVDVDFFVCRLPGAVDTIRIETEGFWLVAEDDKRLALPFTRAVKDATIEYNELGEDSYRSFGGYFSVVRTPNVAKKINISGWVERNSGAIATLEKIMRDNLICILSSSKGLYCRVVLGKNPKISDVAELHGKKMYNMQVTCLEIGWDK
jgi:hypothetical protein